MLKEKNIEFRYKLQIAHNTETCTKISIENHIIILNDTLNLMDWI